MPLLVSGSFSLADICGTDIGCFLNTLAFPFVAAGFHQVTANLTSLFSQTSSTLTVVYAFVIKNNHAMITSGKVEQAERTQMGVFVVEAGIYDVQPYQRS